MGALSALLAEDVQRERQLEYMAVVGWSIGKFFYRDNYIPCYTDMTKKEKDTRTGAQIVDDLAAKFRKRIEKRKKEG